MLKWFCKLLWFNIPFLGEGIYLVRDLTDFNTVKKVKIVYRKKTGEFIDLESSKPIIYSSDIKYKFVESMYLCAYTNPTGSQIPGDEWKLGLWGYTYAKEHGQKFYYKGKLDADLYPTIGRRLEKLK